MFRDIKLSVKIKFHISFVILVLSLIADSNDVSYGYFNFSINEYINGHKTLQFLVSTLKKSA